MANRTQLTLGEACPVGTTSDFLFQLRCDEVAAASNLADALPGTPRTMTQTNSPTVTGALIGLDPAAGSRTFNGTTQYAGRAAADGDETLFQYAGGGYGFACWVTPASIGGTEQMFAEYGEWASPETLADNVQFSVRVNTTGFLRVLWENGAGVNVTITSTNAVFSNGVKAHVGVSVAPSLLYHNQFRVRFYINGRCIDEFDNQSPPTGGTAARWIIGASRNSGAAVGTPGMFFNGALDDIMLCKWAPEHEFFRDLFGSSVRDYREQNLGSQMLPASEVAVRVLVDVGVAEFTTVQKVNLTDVDLSNVEGLNFVAGARLSRSIDDLMWTLEVDLIARFGGINWSPFADKDPANEWLDNPVGHNTPSSTLLRPSRRIKLEVATLPAGTQGTAWNGSTDLHDYFHLMFDGLIVGVTPSADGKLLITALDMGRKLQKTWIEPGDDGQDRSYGSATAASTIESQMQLILNDCDPATYDIIGIDDVAGATLDVNVEDVTAGLIAGKPNTLISGDSVKITGTTNYNGTYTLQTTGTDATQMRTSTAPGAFAAETAGKIAGVPGKSYLGGKGVPTLYTPVSPAWNPYVWNVTATQNVLQHLSDIAEQIGWHCAYVWDDVRREFRLTFYDPASGPSATQLRADEIWEFDKLGFDDENLRTVGTVEYANQSQKDSADERPRYIVAAAASAAAIDAWGRCAFRVAVGEDSLVTKDTEATDLLNTILYDVQLPSSDGSLVVPFTYDIDPARALLLRSEDQSFAYGVPTLFNGNRYCFIESVEHSFGLDGFKTTMGIYRFDASDPSGAPGASRRQRHHEVVAGSGSVPGMGAGKIATPGAPGVSYLGAINGIRTVVIYWSSPFAQANTWDKARHYDFTEVHTSTVSSTFVPSASTLRQYSRGGQVTIANNTIVPAASTIYVRLIHRDTLRNQSAVSTATSFVT